MRWHEKSFAELSTGELYAILQLRQQVFVVEQRCPYLDADGLDPQARHLFAVEDGDAGGTEGAPPTVLATARLFAPGLHAPEAVIGRVVSAPSLRKTGVGRELMRRAIASLAPSPIRIGAQKYLTRFYQSLGFVRAGADYLEDDIEHLPMVRAPQLGDN